MGALTLLNTRDGDYAAACSLDFQCPNKRLNVAVLHHDLGRRSASPSWARHYSKNPRDAARDEAPFPMYSCGGGLVVFDAALSYAGPELRFQSLNEALVKGGIFADERCLISADIQSKDR